MKNIRIALVVWFALTVGLVGSASAYVGHGDDNLPCETGGYWVITLLDGVAPDLTVDGTSATFVKLVGNGSTAHYESGPVTSDSVVVVTPDIGQLQLSHCIEEEQPSVQPSASVTPSESPGPSNPPSEEPSSSPTPSTTPSATPTPTSSLTPTSQPSSLPTAPPTDETQQQREREFGGDDLTPAGLLFIVIFVIGYFVIDRVYWTGWKDRDNK